MKKDTGIYISTKKDGSIYYRVSLTYRNKHISLGSFTDKEHASHAYREAKAILSDSACTHTAYTPKYLGYDKFITLVNFRDNGIYIKTPIYIMPHFFLYYYSSETIFTFDIDDLFYYANHKIMKRGRHLFVADYGMQVNILNRYGIRNYAVENRDYYFANHNSSDFRYSNVICINPYYGVTQQKMPSGQCSYKVKIHINGNYLVGTYHDLNQAAIAYNKAVDIVKKQGYDKNYDFNYIEGLSPAQYAQMYSECSISDKLYHLIL